MFTLPKAAEPLVRAFSGAFTRPTFQRVTLLILGVILSLRRRTITGILRALGPLAQRHWSDFHRVLCCRVGSTCSLGCGLVAMILERVTEDQPVVGPADHTHPQHQGKHVYGKGRHHDACRSTHSHRVSVWGHNWVTLAIHIKVPFCSRPWALPVLVALVRPEEWNPQHGRRHKTPTRRAMQLLAMLMHGFPERKLMLVGDGGYASHELARFCHRHQEHVTLGSRFHPQANLYEAPANRRSRNAGRPPVKGRKLPMPHDVGQPSKGQRFTVDAWGGGPRCVELSSGEGHGFKAKNSGGRVPVRWVFVDDLTSTHRDESFHGTDPALAREKIVGRFTGRWSIEVTFQEVRAHLGFTTVRNGSRKSVLRTAPCRLGLFSLVSLMLARAGEAQTPKAASGPWYPKTEATFSDAMRTVRRQCWQEIFRIPGQHAGVTKLPTRLRITLLDHLSQVA